MMHQAFVALGSNLHNPIAQVQLAFKALAQIPHTQLVKTSSLYQTAPIDCKPDTDDFINAVAEISTALAPLDLLTALHSIEKAVGRERPYINAPRILDCDLLLYDNAIITSPAITVPHPRMHTRGFVLLPLFEIAPTLSHPIHGKIAALITSELAQGIHKLAPSNESL